MKTISIATSSPFAAEAFDAKNIAQSEFELLKTDQAAKVIGGAFSSRTSTPASTTDVNSSSVPSTPTAKLNQTAWSEALQTVLEQPPAALPRNIILGGFLFAAVVGTWSWFSTVEDVSFAQGKLAPKGDVYRVQPAVSGEVIHLYIEEGDRVEQGQKIAEIDHQLIEKEIQRLEENLNAYQLQLGQTAALMQQTQSELNILQAMSQADMAARRSSLMQEQATIATHEKMLAQYEADRQAQVGRMRRLEELVEKGAFAEDHLFQLEQSLRDRDRSIVETQGGIERSIAAIDQHKAEMNQTKATAKKQILATQEKLQQLEIEATDLKSNIREVQILLDKSRAELGQTVLVSPITGVISSLEVANKGEVLQVGETVAEIAPASAPLILSTALPSQEAGLVEEKMPVNIKFDAFPYQDYGIITGTVTSISPDAEVDEEIGAVYHVEIDLDQASFEYEGKSVPLKAGQTATAEIIVQRRRLISLVLDPIRKLQKGKISL